MKPHKKDYIKYKDFSIYYEIYGSETSSKPPLLVLHGGPGAAHNYVLALAKIATVDRQVIFYDQIGCGESAKPTDRSLWTIDFFVNEVETVRKALKLENIHLLGHSWGGMLAIEYLLKKPLGIKSAILASPMISMPLYNQEVDLLKSQLPGGTFKVMKTHEKMGTTKSKEYQDAYSIYAKHHLFRGDKYPPEYSVDPKNRGNDVYQAMWGVSEAWGNGSMKLWDRIDDLHTIEAPTLITSGQYDELTPWQASIASNKIPNSNLKIFTNTAHVPHIERESDYIEEINKFISEND
jgi:proline-specific peptidase